ncbi:MAG: hypothetical protein RL329_1689 [Bacteroidota bacterium]
MTKKEMVVMDVRISRIFNRFSRILTSLELQIRENRVKIREIRTSITYRSFFYKHDSIT